VPSGSGCELLSFTHHNHLELQARGLGFGEHTWTLQEDEAWLAPLGETPQAADDLVFRA
jgi:hypothetical protein